MWRTGQCQYTHSYICFLLSGQNLGGEQSKFGRGAPQHLQPQRTPSRPQVMKRPSQALFHNSPATLPTLPHQTCWACWGALLPSPGHSPSAQGHNFYSNWIQTTTNSQISIEQTNYKRFGKHCIIKVSLASTLGSCCWSSLKSPCFVWWVMRTANRKNKTYKTKFDSTKPKISWIFGCLIDCPNCEAGHLHTSPPNFFAPA